MPRIEQVLRKGGKPHPRPRPPGPATTIILTFDASVTDADGGVSGVVGSTNANQRFSFTEIMPRTGLPADLEISESSTLKMVVTFSLDYAGASYVYTDTAGAAHSGIFPATNGTVNY